MRAPALLLGPVLALVVSLAALPADAASRQDPIGGSPVATRLVTPATAPVLAPQTRQVSRDRRRAPLPLAGDAWTGYAFDACRAPSRRVMDRWRVTSPFLGVGIYIGGSLRACPQRHLSRGWVRHQVEHGWKLLPIWVGPQASCTSYRRTITGRPGARDRYPVARTQGAREARKATAAARRLGLGRGATLWYDLEWFPAGNRDCRRSALHFMSRWTEQLHRSGYRSGVYSSVSAGAAVLGRVRGNVAFTKPDKVWFAWANGRRDVRWNKYVDAPRWKTDRRVHQYALDVVARYGGHTMAIDRNFVDLGSSPTTRRAPATCGRGADRAHYRPLRRGDRGARVKALQCLLDARGRHRGGVTGSFGTETRAAVRAFQQRRGLRVTGRANERTWTALLAAGSRPVLKRGSEGPAVRRLQRALTSALPGVVAVHGHFGPATTSAVARYQARTGLRVTGVASPGTWRALRTGEVVQAKHAKKSRHGAGRDDHKTGKDGNGGKHGKAHGKKDGPDKPKQKSSKPKKGKKAKDKPHGHGKHRHGHTRR